MTNTDDRASNWGPQYRSHGILAHGQDVVGARAGGGIVSLSGSSFATPLVSGVAALLLSFQLARGLSPNPLQVREAILASAKPCPMQATDCDRFLRGVLDAAAALEFLSMHNGATMNDPIPPIETTSHSPELARPAAPPAPAAAPAASNSVTPSASALASGCGCGSTAPDQQKSLVYAIGGIGFDFGTEARRDTFRQLMPYFTPPTGGGPFPPNPYDPEQLVAYLNAAPDESTKLIWTRSRHQCPGSPSRVS